MSDREDRLTGHPAPLVVQLGQHTIDTPASRLGGSCSLPRRTASIRPPLVVTRGEIDRMVAIADEALTIAEGEFASEFAG